MAADVVWNGMLGICGDHGVEVGVPESRTSMMAIVVGGVPAAWRRAARVSRLMC